MQEIEPLLPGELYHIYNRGINGEDLFREPRNYRFFLEKYAQYVAPFVDTFAYCLLKNLFHLLIRVKDFSLDPVGWATLAEANGWSKPADASRQFGHFFNSYTQAVNKSWHRTGGLFTRPFRREPIRSEAYFTRAIAYVQTNAQRHGFVPDFRTYPYSSYASHLSDRPTLLARQEVLNWFGNVAQYQLFHETYFQNPSAAGFEIEVDEPGLPYANR
jgi:hypothetical protein